MTKRLCWVIGPPQWERVNQSLLLWNRLRLPVFLLTHYHLGISCHSPIRIRSCQKHTLSILRNGNSSKFLWRTRQVLKSSTTSRRTPTPPAVLRQDGICRIFLCLTRIPRAVLKEGQKLPPHLDDPTQFSQTKF